MSDVAERAYQLLREAIPRKEVAQRIAADALLVAVRDARRELVRVYLALRKYGKHVDGCQGGSLSPIRACTCGYRKAIVPDYTPTSGATDE